MLVGHVFSRLEEYGTVARKSEAKSSKDATPRLRLNLYSGVTPSARMWKVGLATGYSIVPVAA